ncbi:MAG: hypothetical protein E3K37_03615 [Candidatus Kuenenia sp.]|nr:hypothetical protein [Candidatus Kuenenia hertensis]
MNKKPDNVIYAIVCFKRQPLIMFLIALMSFTASIANQNNAIAGKTQLVTVEGVGAIINDDKAGARDEALRDAYRRAVEKGTGISIESETQVDLFIILKDIILARSQGYIRNWEINEECVRDENLYSVKINAEVVNGYIEKDEHDALKIIIDLMGNPRFLVLIDEKNLDTDPPYSVLETELIECMVKCGFHCVDAEQIKQNRRAEELMEHVWKGNSDVAGKLARNVGADVVITGKVYTRELPVPEILYESGMVSCKAYASVKAIIAETGKIIDINNTEKVYTSITGWDAGIKAIKLCGKNLAQELVWDIPLYLGPSQTRTVELEINNIGYSEYITLKNKLCALRGVVHVFQREWQAGNPAIFDIKTIFTAEELAARCNDLDLKIIKYNRNKIELVKH